MTEENEKLQTKHKQQFWFKVGLTVIILLWLSNFLILFCHNPGTIGDSFGVVNSLFSGLAFGGIIYTIILQRDELQLQRDELSLTRLELKRSANAQEDSQKALERQAANLKKVQN
ncbi:MAG: hypothetical protein IPK08_03400 [Bacteroidetes bacterium]|nr:hypothetical protein [Bacteroidota bacterium]